MAGIPTQTLRVLQHALELKAFTLPQLASDSGVSYETVKRTLRAEEERGTVERPGKTAVHGVGRPPEIWKVIDPVSIETRIANAQEAVGGIETDAPTTRKRLHVAPLDLSLAVAEDELVFAVRADDPEDAATFASRALTTLHETGIDPTASWNAPSATAPLVLERNLKTREARALIVKCVAEYIGSDEDTGFAGPLWRRAFQALASVQLTDQAALHRQFLVDLVRLADERAFIRQANAHLELTEMLARMVLGAPGAASTGELTLSLRSESQVHREAVRAALAQLVSEVAAGERAFNRDATKNLQLLVRMAFPRGSETPAQVLQMLVDSLCVLATRTDTHVAGSAQETLLAVHQPRHVSFWHHLADATPAASHRTIFAGLSHISLEEAFSYLRDALARSVPVDEVGDVLLQVLPEIDLDARTDAQACFAEFLASVPGEQRNQLMATPLLAGLDWSSTPFERRLVSHFFAVLTRWRAFVRGEHTDDRVIAQTTALGQQLEMLAVETLPLLGGEEQRRLIQVLAPDIHRPAVAAVCVPVLLDLGLETELARTLVRTTTADDVAWASVMSWYLDVCPLDRLDSTKRSALLNALRTALSQYASTFLIGLAGRAAESQEELHELTENPEIEPRLRLELEMGMTDSYGTAAQELEAFAVAHGTYE
jgi:hypothetical protein